MKLVVLAQLTMKKTHIYIITQWNIHFCDILLTGLEFVLLENKIRSSLCRKVSWPVGEPWQLLLEGLGVRRDQARVPKHHPPLQDI